jgi:hypothetical protein
MSTSPDSPVVWRSRLCYHKYKTSGDVDFDPCETEVLYGFFSRDRKKISGVLLPPPVSRNTEESTGYYELRTLYEPGIYSKRSSTHTPFLAALTLRQQHDTGTIFSALDARCRAKKQEPSGTSNWFTGLKNNRLEQNRTTNLSSSLF